MITVEQKIFKNKLTLIKDLLKQKSSNIFNSLMIDCSDVNVKMARIYVYNPDVQVRLDCPEIQFTTPGTIMLPYTAIDLISKMKGTIKIVKVAPDKIDISGFSIVGRPNDTFSDYVRSPFPTAMDKEISISVSDFKELVEKVSHASLQDHEQAREVIKGVQIRARDGFIEAMATNSYILAFKKITADISEEFLALIPNLAIKKIMQILQKKDGSLKIGISNDKVCVVGTDFAVYSKLVDENLPDYKYVVPSSFHTELKVETERFREIVALFTSAKKEDKKKDIVVINYNNGKLGFQQDFATPKIKEMSVTGEDKPFTVGFNPNFLLAVTKTVETKEFIFKINDRSASMLQETDNTDFLALIMPVRKP